jgi:succinate-semialdehyde dehydrogenase/glutarate-semialdehyde dehydrogenase
MAENVAANGEILLFIDGAWGAAKSGATLPVLNPATGEPIGSVARAGKPDLDRALAAAERGFAAWRKVSAYEGPRCCARPATSCASAPTRSRP